jgi:hypothetical protein
LRLDERAHQAGRGQHDEQEAEAFGGTQQHQRRHALSQTAERTDDRQQHESQRHAATAPERVGDDAEDHAERHAGELHQRQQEAGLDQRQAERLAQHRDRGRQLADVERRDDAGEDHEQGGIDAAHGSCRHGLQVSPRHEAPPRHDCCGCLRQTLRWRRHARRFARCSAVYAAAADARSWPWRMR